MNENLFLTNRMFPMKAYDKLILFNHGIIYVLFLGVCEVAEVNFRPWSDIVWYRWFWVECRLETPSNSTIFSWQRFGSYARMFFIWNGFEGVSNLHFIENHCNCQKFSGPEVMWKYIPSKHNEINIMITEPCTIITIYVVISKTDL